jgi:hypothetical protein
LFREGKAGIDEHIARHVIQGLTSCGQKRPRSTVADEDHLLTGRRMRDLVDLSRPVRGPAGERAGQIGDEYLVVSLADRSGQGFPRRRPNQRTMDQLERNGHLR